MSGFATQAEVISKTLKEKPVSNGGTISQAAVVMRYGRGGFEATATMLMDVEDAERIQLGMLLSVSFEYPTK